MHYTIKNKMKFEPFSKLLCKNRILDLNKLLLEKNIERTKSLKHKTIDKTSVRFFSPTFLHYPSFTIFIPLEENVLNRE